MPEKLRIFDWLIGPFFVGMMIFLDFLVPRGILGVAHYPFLAAISFLSAYPFFGKGQKPYWAFVGEQSFWKWIFFSAIIFVVTLIMSIVVYSLFLK